MTRVRVLLPVLVVAVASCLAAGCSPSNPADDAVVIITESPAEDGGAPETPDPSAAPPTETGAPANP